MIALENIRIFLRAIETGSFSAAGRMLRLSPSVVSYRIQLLEDTLGARLLTRTTRNMRLTEAGEVFLEHCREIVEAVERAEASVAESTGASPRGVLRVTAPLGLGRRVIAPMVARYRELQPHTDVRLRLSDHILDIVREGVDLAIRLARMEDFELHPAQGRRRRARALRRARLSRAARRAQEPARPLEPRLPAAALSRLAAIPLDAGIRGRVDLRPDRRPGRRRRRRRADPMGARRPRHRAEAAVRSRRPISPTGGSSRCCPRRKPQPVTLGILYPTRRMLPPRTKSFIDLAVEELRRHLNGQLGLLGERRGAQAK